jgi:SAM-dependent methyltransferase
MPEDIVNHFVHESAAARYAAARPYFHPIVMDRIKRLTGQARFDRGLDVACGTGQSSHALAEVAKHVDAIDVSKEMLDCAQPHERIRYQHAPAESLPFPDAEFDLITVGLAFHWFDQEPFLREARRVLKDHSWLAIYNNGFAGEMIENPNFRNWAFEIYPKRFPTPLRKSWGVTADSVKPFGFDLAAEEPFENPIPMSRAQLLAYLLTQTNVIAAVENGSTKIEEVAEWIETAIAPYFGDTSKTMRFSGRIWLLKSRQ